MDVGLNFFGFFWRVELVEFSALDCTTEQQQQQVTQQERYTNTLTTTTAPTKKYNMLS